MITDVQKGGNASGGELVRDDVKIVPTKGGEADDPVMELVGATGHPLEPWFSEAEIRAVVARGGQDLADLCAAFEERERLIKLGSDDEQGDPFRYGWDLPHWKAADAELRALLAELKAKGVSSGGQYCSGGKRATKSERAAWRTVQSGMAFGRGKIWCGQGNSKTSIAEQQSLIWKYLPKEVKDLNQRRSSAGWAKINYSQENGFAAGDGHMLVLPNRTEIHFITYGSPVKDYQGWKLGSPWTKEMEHLMRVHPHLFNLGAWLDEDVPLDWLQTARARCSTNGACWLWTFSTLEGITPTIKELLTGHRTTRSRVARDLPQNQKHVPDCEAGHMPVMARVAAPDVSVVYFHTDLNPFPGNYENMRGLVGAKPVEVIKRDLYGWCEDTRGRAFPKFGAWNIVPRSALPAEGTNYKLVDPHGTRMWATIWVRVSRGNPRRFYVYRDWPDARRFGVWAVPNKKPGEVNGDEGPAQGSKNYGYIRYKLAWLGEERIVPSFDAEGRLVGEADPMRMKILEKVLAHGHYGKGKGLAGPEAGVPLEEPEGGWAKWAEERNLKEPILWNLIDPRAGKDSVVAAKGGTCVIDELVKEDRDAHGRVLAPGMLFQPAAGLRIEAGLREVANLLDWDQTRPLTPIVNEPRLYVAEECEQVIWALSNYVEGGAEDAGCEDFVALLRYMATSDLRHVEAFARGDRMTATSARGY